MSQGYYTAEHWKCTGIRKKRLKDVHAQEVMYRIMLVCTSCVIFSEM